MTFSNRYYALALSLMCASLLAVSGCATPGKGPVSKSSATIQAVMDDYREAQRQTTATLQAVDALPVASTADLEQSFKYFSGNVKMMEQVGQRLTRHADGMFYRGPFYFVESGKSLEACALPRSGMTDDRRSIDLGPDFYPISDAGGKVKNSLEAFLFDIEQIQDLINHIGTPAAVNAADKIIDKADIDGKSLNEALQQGLNALERAAKNLQQSAPPAPPAPQPSALPAPPAPRAPVPPAPRTSAPPVPLPAARPAPLATAPPAPLPPAPPAPLPPAPPAPLPPAPPAPLPLAPPAPLPSAPPAPLTSAPPVPLPAPAVRTPYL